MSSIDQVLAWLDDVISDAELVLRDERAGLQFLTAQLDESWSFAEQSS
jgi:hypothetical protein